MWRLVAFDHLVRTRLNDARMAGIKEPRIMVGYPTLVYYEGCHDYSYLVPKMRFNEKDIQGLEINSLVIKGIGNEPVYYLPKPQVERGFYDGVFRWAPRVSLSKDKIIGSKDSLLIGG